MVKKIRPWRTLFGVGYQRRYGASCSASSRRGATLIELLVSFTLLATMMTVAASSMVRYGQLQQTLRRDQLAMNVLCNQCDMLATFSSAERLEQILHLEPSDVIAPELPDVALSGVVDVSEGGQRLTLCISWAGSGTRRHERKLQTWFFDGEELEP